MKKKESEYLSKIASLGCIVCSNLGHEDTPAEIHHPRFAAGMSQKSSHFLAIPLCPPHHRTGGKGYALHAGQEMFERNFGTEAQLLADTIEAMQ